MVSRRQWTIARFDPAAHSAGVLRLWAAVSGFDGSVPARSADELDALLAHPAAERGQAWRVAVAGNDAIVGMLEVRFIGTKRTELSVAVNPAWRRQGIGRALLASLPEGKRLLASSKRSLEGSAAFLEALGFAERWSDPRLRRSTEGVKSPKLPGWATLEEEPGQDLSRLLRVARVAVGPDEIDGDGDGSLLLARPKARVLYLRTPQGDQGLLVVGAQTRAKRADRDAEGQAKVAVMEHIGLAKDCRGKGLSRPFVQAGIALLARAGFADVEVVVDGRRDAARDLYQKLGFEVVDEEVRWIRRDDED